MDFQLEAFILKNKIKDLEKENESLKNTIKANKILCEKIRLGLIELFKDTPFFPTITFQITSILWQIVYRKDKI